jgi:uncharacterized protein
MMANTSVPTPVQAIYYSDLSYSPELTQLGDIQLVTNVDDIKQSINTIVYTPPGSRLFEPTFGVGIEQFLFEPFTEATGAAIGKAIENGINKYEPRVALQSVNVVMNANLSYSIAVQYLIIDTQTTSNISIQLTRS